MNDKILQKEIQSLEIYCTNKEKGCDWEGTLKDLPVHMETCGLIIIDCPNGCGARFERRFMSRHQREDCAKRSITCEFCMIETNVFYKNNNFYLLIKVKHLLYLKMKFLI